MQARVDYKMQLGPLFLLDSVQYFPRVYIRPGRYFYHHRLSALQKGRPFSIAALEDDRTVTRAFLREHGYILATKLIPSSPHSVCTYAQCSLRARLPKRYASGVWGRSCSASSPKIPKPPRTSPRRIA